MDPQRPPEPRADRGSMVIAAAIVGAAFILSWGMSGSQPRYQLAGGGGAVVRMDTDSGEMIACNLQRCARIEQPDRAKVLGPLRMEFSGGDRKALPPPAPSTNEAR